MQDYKYKFIQFCIEYQVLKFGLFTLKSGRQSPYFFNAGLFNTGQALLQLGQFYAAAIQDANIQYDMLFGPAYKGIPLACTAAMGLAQHYHLDKPYCFNRKEKKDHGESGVIVGHPLKGRVLIIDDVITAGTAIRESIPLIEHAQAQLAGVVIMLDRQERGLGTVSAIKEIEEHYGIPVISIIQLTHIIEYLKKESNREEALGLIQTYQDEYGTH